MAEVTNTQGLSHKEIALLESCTSARSIQIVKIMEGEGYSAAKVLIADFIPIGNHNQPNGYKFIKIDHRKHIARETRKHNTVRTTQNLTGYVPEIIEHITPSPEAMQLPEMQEDPIEAIVMEPAGKDTIDVRSLKHIIKRKNEGEEKYLYFDYHKRLSDFVNVLGYWNNTLTDNDRETIAPREWILRAMNTGSQNKERHKELIHEFLPNTHHKGWLMLHGERVPNPIGFALNDSWWKGVDNLTALMGRVHGDLHSGNILFNTSGNDDTPYMIDFNRHENMGPRFYDIAQLELDLLIQLVKVYDQATWQGIMQDITREDITFGQSFRNPASRYVQSDLSPLRAYVADSIATTTVLPDMEYAFKMTWWLTATGVGLEFARRTNYLGHIQSGISLMYAAWCLRRALNMMGLPYAYEECKTFSIDQPPPYIFRATDRLVDLDFNAILNAQEKAPEEDYPIKPESSPLPEKADKTRDIFDDVAAVLLEGNGKEQDSASDTDEHEAAPVPLPLTSEPSDKRPPYLLYIIALIIIGGGLLGISAIAGTDPDATETPTKTPPKIAAVSTTETPETPLTVTPSPETPQVMIVQPEITPSQTPTATITPLPTLTPSLTPTLAPRLSRCNTDETDAQAEINPAVLEQFVALENSYWQLYEDLPRDRDIPPSKIAVESIDIDENIAWLTFADDEAQITGAFSFDGQYLDNCDDFEQTVKAITVTDDDAWLVSGANIFYLQDGEQVELYDDVSDAISGTTISEIKDLYILGNNIWLWTDAGIIYRDFNAQSWSPYYLGDVQAVYTVTDADNNHYIYHSRNKIVVRHQANAGMGDTFILINTLTDATIQNDDVTITHIAVHDDVVYAVIEGVGLYSANDDDGAIFEPFVPSPHIVELEIDNRGDLWISEADDVNARYMVRAYNAGRDEWRIEISNYQVNDITFGCGDCGTVFAFDYVWLATENDGVLYRDLIPPPRLTPEPTDEPITATSGARNQHTPTPTGTRATLTQTPQITNTATTRPTDTSVPVDTSVPASNTPDISVQSTSTPDISVQASATPVPASDTPVTPNTPVPADTVSAPVPEVTTAPPRDTDVPTVAPTNTPIPTATETPPPGHTNKPPTNTPRPTNTNRPTEKPSNTPKPTHTERATNDNRPTQQPSNTPRPTNEHRP